MTEQDPTQRFTNRVENYVRYRPTYPAAAIDCLRDECGLGPGAAVADVGSGTGILTELLLQRGATVYGVEPNGAMRGAAEAALSGYPGFVSVDGRAEATTLPAASVDLITAGQAFHWFEPVGTRTEFQRILRPGGWVGLIWNARDEQSGGFAVDYEALLNEYARGYRAVRRDAHFGKIDILFPDGYERRVFRHERRLDYESVHGGLLSSSYAPLPGDPNYQPMIARLRAIFDDHQRQGFVNLAYETHLYLGRLE